MMGLRERRARGARGAREARETMWAGRAGGF